VSASRPSTVQRLAVGDHLEGYTIVGELGEGGFSKVFRVETGFGDTAALKLAKSTSPNPYGGGTVALCFAQPIAFHTGGIGPGSPTPSQVIEREGLMLRGLDDPLFPRVIETGMLADRAFVVYEEIAGETLRARIQRRDPVPIEFFLAIGEALAIRQQDGRLPFHGDLKPDNVMIDDFGNWRLLDPACAAAEGKPLGSRGLITTPSYYPFLMPDDPSANIIMICTGTGSAPFRAFTERRRRAMPQAPGKLYFFFGARTPGELPYFGPLKKVPTSLLDKELVFSRLADRPKEYVQDRMLKRGEDLAEVLSHATAHIFVCGLKGMEEGVDASFAKICADLSHWPELRDRMRAEGRYHVETY